MPEAAAAAGLAEGPPLQPPGVGGAGEGRGRGRGSCQQRSLRSPPFARPWGWEGGVLGPAALILTSPAGTRVAEWEGDGGAQPPAGARGLRAAGERQGAASSHGLVHVCVCRGEIHTMCIFSGKMQRH